MEAQTTFNDGGIPPMGDLINDLFRGFAPITDRKTDMRDCGNYFEPLKDEEEEL